MVELTTIDSMEDLGDLPGEENPEPIYLIWKRLQLSKAKLRGVTEVAALMAGFSVVATVELQISSKSPEALLTMFVITTAGLVSSAMLSIMISTCILPHIEAVAKSASEDSHQTSKSLSTESPHDALIFYIDLSWVLANVVSIFLFILDVILLSWIKYPCESRCNCTCAISVTAIMIPVLLLIIIFSLIFYWQTLSQQYIISDRKYHELELMNNRLSRHERMRTRSLGRTTSGASNYSTTSHPLNV